MQRAPTVSMLLLALMLSGFEAMGLDADRILARAGLSREAIADPHARVSLEAYFRCWDAALDVSGDPALGLRVGGMLRVGSLGSFEYLLRNCESLSQVIERANEFMRLVADLVVLELRRDGDVAILRIYREGGYPSTPPEVHAFFAALVVVAHSESLARSGSPTARLSSVRFAHAAPADLEVFRRHFGCPVYFDQRHDEVSFPAEALARGPIRADGALARVLEEHARHLLEQLPDEDPLMRSARSELLKLIDTGKPSQASLAKALGMSERTLRRRLEAEGTTYNALLDGLRSDLARRYVTQTREGFEAIARRLAFADASAFFRGFKRWTGVTPAQFRATGGKESG
jgi:AraC-like DNA-binding protein